MNFLIVDDEFVSLSKLTMFLGSYGKCDSVTHGKQAMDVFNQAASKGQYYDLIIFDIHLPDFNGLELFKLFKMKEEKLKLPIAKKIIISANGSPYNVAIAAKNHCDGFIIKPFKNDVLRDKLIELGILKSKKSTFQKTSNTNTIKRIIHEKDRKNKKEETRLANKANWQQNQQHNEKKQPNEKRKYKSLSSAERYELKLKLKERKKDLFKFCLRDQTMMVLLEAIVEQELRRQFDEQEN